MAAARIEWFGPKVGELEQSRVAAVIASNYINDGPTTREFEKRVADMVGVRHCVAVTSCTVGLSLALMAVGIGPSDEVLIPDLTFIATANAVRMIGAEVKLIDVEPYRFTIDPEKVASAIGSRTKAIISVDVNGRGCDYDQLEVICKQYGLKLVCDAAEGLGSHWHGRSLGAIGDAGCFSFSANKTISSGQGGMIATNSEDVYFRLRELKDQGRRHGGTGGDDLHPVMGFNFKYTSLQAAVGLAQLDQFDERVAHFAQRDSWYRDLLGDCPGVTFPPLANWKGELLQWTDVLCSNRAAVQEALDARDIGTRAFWLPLHRQVPYRRNDQDFPVAIDVSARGLWLPSSFDLSRADVEEVAAVFRETMQEAAL